MKDENLPKAETPDNPTVTATTHAEATAQRKKARAAARAAGLALLKNYVHQFKPNDIPTGSLIGKVSYRAYTLRVSQADTVRILKDYFRENGDRQRAWWIKSMVKGARQLAEKNEGLEEIS